MGHNLDKSVWSSVNCHASEEILRFNTVHAVNPSVQTDAGVLGRGCGLGFDAEHTAVELGRHNLSRHTHEEAEAEAARCTALDTAVGWSSLGRSQRSGQNDPEMIRHETGRGMRHSPHSRSPPELVVNSAKGEPENWTCSWRMGYHHDPPESSSLES